MPENSRKCKVRSGKSKQKTNHCSLFTIHYERGSLLVIAIIFLLFVLMFSVAIFTNVANFSRFGSNATMREQAVNLSEAGIDYAVWNLNNNPDYLNDDAGNQIDTKQFGPGSFEVDIDHGLPNGKKKIRVLGYIPAWPSFNIKVKGQVEVTSSQSGAWQIVRGTYKFSR